jgi:hypothetical protein
MQPLSSRDIRATRPVIRATPHGWLATSAPDCQLRIGVFGVDEADARRRFGEEVEAWAQLRDAPEAQERADA